MVIHLLPASFERYPFKWRPNLPISAVQVMGHGMYLFMLEMDLGSLLSSALWNYHLVLKNTADV